MSFHEGSKWQEQQEDKKRMSAHNHDTEDPNLVKYGVAKVKSLGKEPLSFESGHSEEERIGSYIRVWGQASNRSLKDFINWCAEQDYYFERPIK